MFLLKIYFYHPWKKLQWEANLKGISDILKECMKDIC